MEPWSVAVTGLGALIGAAWAGWTLVRAWRHWKAHERNDALYCAGVAALSAVIPCAFLGMTVLPVAGNVAGLVLMTFGGVAMWWEGRIRNADPSERTGDG